MFLRSHFLVDNGDLVTNIQTFLLKSKTRTTIFDAHISTVANILTTTANADLRSLS